MLNCLFNFKIFLFRVFSYRCEDKNYEVEKLDDPSASTSGVLGLYQSTSSSTTIETGNLPDEFLRQNHGSMQAEVIKRVKTKVSPGAAPDVAADVGFSRASIIAFARPIISRAKIRRTSMLGWPTLTGAPCTWM
jgi:hypothetical protein